MLNRILKSLILACMMAAAGSSAGSPHSQYHAIQFDLVNDNPGIEILNYRYGNSTLVGTHAPKWQLEQGHVNQATFSRGEILVGDSLYAKWRVRASGQVFEQTVDLERLLPPDIRDHTVYFTIDGEHLYVFLISPEKLRPNPCSRDPEMRRQAQSSTPVERVLSRYCDLKVKQLYPPLTN